MIKTTYSVITGQQFYYEKQLPTKAELKQLKRKRRNKLWD